MPNPAGGSSLSGEAYLSATCRKSCPNKSTSLIENRFGRVLIKDIHFLKHYSPSLLNIHSSNACHQDRSFSIYSDLESYITKVELQIWSLPNRKTFLNNYFLK